VFKGIPSSVCKLNRKTDNTHNTTLFAQLLEYQTAPVSKIRHFAHRTNV